MEPVLICTIGHSNRTIDEFVDLLLRNDIRHVLDVRTVPRSRHNPHFNTDVLPTTLAQYAISYTHCKRLGGLRRPRPDSPNKAWRNISFRGYADYMQTLEFDDGIEDIIRLAALERCVLMCAEAVPWRCHRSMIADALLARGLLVEDIMGPGARKPRSVTPFAHVVGHSITYPACDAAHD